jgi:hypothetical protein
VDAKNLEPITSLNQLSAAEAGCTRCPLYRDATQAVPGEGPSRAPSALLRIEDENDRHAAYRSFVADLKKAAAEVAASHNATHSDQ